ncbi:M50 family metallopeptidase [Myxococcus landrumensis]|uniref:M50 family metallopeptidase n=1 Tax=Myxococcus landrumensis TaxID=2813577 RepID=A0ABX7NB08_9BACT|nr:M50 family metallopeptidase [Myxococcus landrumus]QSQ14800.1 M50 family metallopeptidase [Myxococcus landrumus]
MKPLFHIGGFPVRVHPFFFLSALATGWGVGLPPERWALWMGVAFVSVLLHECGHAWVLRRLGAGARITLHGLGGTTESTREVTHRQAVMVSLAGPAMGLLLGGLAWAVSRAMTSGTGGLAHEVVRQVLWVNLGWALINLLPVQPLDGGDALASFMRARAGARHERALRILGIGTSALMLGWALWSRTVWVGMLAVLLGWLNVRQLRRLPPPRPAPVRRTSAQRPSAEGAVTLNELLGRGASPPAGGGESKPSGPQASVRERLPRQESAEPELPPDSAAVGQLLLDSGLAALAVRPLQESFTQEPSSHSGHALVLALLEAGRTAELCALLSGPHASLLSEETLATIAARAGQESGLADRVTLVRQTRAPKSDERG